MKRVNEILESLNFDLSHIKKHKIDYLLKVNDIEVINYVLSIDGINLNILHLWSAISESKFDIVVSFLNNILCQSIPSHLRNQFHIFQFANQLPNQ